MEKKWSALIGKAGYNDFQSPFLREILNTLPIALFIADLDQRVLFINQTLLSKIPPGDYIGYPCKKLYGENCDTMLCAYQQLQKGHHTCLFNLKGKTWKVQSTYLYDCHHEPWGYCEIITDPNENDTAGHILKSIVNGAPGGVFRICYDDAFTILYANATFSHRHHINPEDSDFLNLTSHLYPQDFKYLHSEISKAIQRKDLTITFEAQVQCTDGLVHWFNYSCGIDYSNHFPIISGFEIDITAQKDLESKLRLSEKQLKIAFAQTNDTIWNYDIHTHTIKQSRFSMRQFGGPEIMRNVPEGQIDSGFVHPDSAETYRQLHQKIISGNRKSEATVRLRHQDGNYEWERIKYRVIKDHSGNPIKAIGISKNISAEMHAKSQAQLDALTQLYNRSFFEERVTGYLYDHPDVQRHSQGALLMIDLDDFKSVNDSYGHAFGDEVLRVISQRLRSCFRYNDLIARMGGDEFSIFLPDLPSEDFAHKKALEVCKTLQMPLYDVTPHDREYQPSCSLGIAFFPEHGTLFSDLYQNADVAQYNAKRTGKNKYAIYGLAMNAESSSSANWMNKEWLMDELDELVYISNISNYDLIYLNRAGRKLTGIGDVDYTGKKCYEIMRGRKSPCPHCNNHQLNPEKFISWRNFNPHLGKSFIMKAKLVPWDGVLSRMEYALDTDIDPEISKQMEKHR
ncbi:diguanylate cyclase domain-containing protein [Eubacterium barkeri]|uniref:Diguanylate cyclase (GGDEF) domain-containing protein n=1 Tax=Eubacterium barkeri TaxID=1528 RepID=A0A1H3GAP1_EUBBA|nr:diguanylate cyclase [Eubacterium barkeri]SDY00125.1 diguanylate cyclase (GGDEF) domain-containing protein [Eubacterium barkeri]